MGGSSDSGSWDGSSSGSAASAVMLALALGACASPTIDVEVEPADAWIVVDGTRRGTDEYHADLPYYGTVDVVAIAPMLPIGDRSPRRAPARVVQPVNEPFSPWLFPLDFVLEAGEAVFAPPEAHRITIELRRNPPMVQGAEPPAVEALRARAREVTTER